MKKCPVQYFLTKTTSATIAAAVTLLAPAPAQAALPANTAFLHGGNWAATGGLVTNIVMYPDGITGSTTVAEAQAVADTVACDYKSVGINFVRFPINPATVNGTGNNWAVDQACINELIAQGMTVDICCWYIAAWTGGNGQIPNGSLWESMWQTVDGVYGANNSVYYEPINEPFGYATEAALSDDVYQFFLNDYGITKSQDHIILDGTGYASSVVALGADSKLSGCLMAVHDYAMWDPSLTTVAGWESNLAGEVGSYWSRTIMTEMGAVSTTGLDYEQSPPPDDNTAFVQGMCAKCNAEQMGFSWFPAHQEGGGNNKRLFNDPGQGVADPSLVLQLQSGWGISAQWSPSWDNPAGGSGFINGFAACSWGSEREDVFGVKSDGNIYHTWYFNGSGWNAWEEHACPVAPAGAPGASANNAVANREDLYFIGTDGNLYHQYYDGAWEPSGLNSWNNLGAPAGVTLVGSPSATSWSAGRYDVYARGSNNTIYHAYSSDGLTYYWTDQGGSVTNDVASESWGAGRLDGYAMGTGTGAIWHQYYTGGTWYPTGTTWAQNTPETNALYSLGACSWGTNRIDLFDVNGPSGSVVGHAWYDFATTSGSPAWGGNWTQTFAPPVKPASGPCATSWGVNRVDIFVLGSDGKCYHLYWGI